MRPKASTFGAKSLERAALGAARKEAYRLDGYLQQALVQPMPGYSRLLLARALVEYHLHAGSFGGVIGAILAGFLFAPLMVFFALTFWGDPSLLISGFLAATYYLELLLLGVALAWWSRRDVDGARRFRRYWPKEIVARNARSRRLLRFVMPALILVCAGAVLIFALQLEGSQLGPLLIQSAAAALWLTFLMILVVQLGLSEWRLVVRRAPEAALARSLATAYGLIIDSKPGEWRNMGYRRRAAVEIGTAATILEGPTLRILAAIPLSPQAPEWRHVRAVAANLRALAAKVVVRGAEERPQVERSLAKALAAAVSGTLGSMDVPPEKAEGDGARSRLGIALRAARNLVVALLPAVGAIAVILAGERYGWAWVQDAKSLLIQVAGISGVIGLMAVLDPSGYHQRLSAITGAGGSLLGWGRRS